MYSVPSLATELGISTTPVREALLELSNRGMIVPMRNRGFKVQASSLEDLENLFEMRELLERFAVVNVARKRLKDTDGLKKLADAVAVAVKARNVGAYLEADRAFHEALVSRAGNPRLTKMIMDLRDDMRLFGIEFGGRRGAATGVRKRALPTRRVCSQRRYEEYRCAHDQPHHGLAAPLQKSPDVANRATVLALDGAGGWR